MRRYQDESFWNDWYTQHRDAPVEWSAPVSATLVSRINAALEKIERPAGGLLRVCELGCGTSSLIVALRREGLEVSGMDFSSEVVNQMQQWHPDIGWKCGDALDLQSIYPDGKCFECVIAKTLLDTFLTRSDATEAIRRLFESVRHVLVDNGWVILLDRANTKSLIHRGHSEQLAIGSSSRQNMMSFRVLEAKAQSETGGHGSDADSEMQPAGSSRLARWELELPMLGDLISTRKVAGGSALVVQKADGAAAEAGLRAGDRLLGVDRCDGKGVQLGEASTLQSALSNSGSLSSLRVLVERSAGEDMAAQSRLTSRSKRSSVAESDFFLRVKRAQMLQDKAKGKWGGSWARGSGANAVRSLSTSVSKSWELPLISTAIDVTKGLFKDAAPSTGLREWKAKQADSNQAKRGTLANHS